jgi:ligand-binding sensor domain-containing protein
MAFYQDSLGFMWVGSNIGLYRFDGNEMKPYLTNYQINDSTELQLQISAIHEDEKGIFWLGLKDCMEASLLKFDRRTNHIESFNIYPDSIPKKQRWINKIHQNEENTLWLPTDAGLFHFNKKNNIASAIIRPSKSDLTFINHLGIYDADGIQFYNFLADPEGEGFWWSTNVGLYLFNPENNQFIGYVPEDVLVEKNIEGKNRLFTRFSYDFAGHLWITINGNIYRFDLSKRVWDPVYKRIRNYERPANQNVGPLIDPRFPERLI